MAEPLATSGEIIASARVLLQDTINSPYRYSDDALYGWLGEALAELKRLRPDLLLGKSLQTFSAASPTDAIVVDAMYRTALTYYVCGRAQIIDDEDVQDQRGAAFIQMFNQKLQAGV